MAVHSTAFEEQERLTRTEYPVSFQCDHCGVIAEAEYALDNWVELYHYQRDGSLELHLCSSACLKGVLADWVGDLFALAFHSNDLSIPGTSYSLRQLRYGAHRWTKDPPEPSTTWYYKRPQPGWIERIRAAIGAKK